MKNENPIGIIFQMECDMQAAETDMALAEAKNAARRHAHRMQMYADWVKPEAIEERRREHEAAAEAALMLGLQAARVQEDIPIPYPLPKHMVGQSLSTIRAMLRNGMAKEEPGKFLASEFVLSKPSGFKIRES